MEWCKFYAEWGTDPKVQSMTESLRCRHAMLLSLRCATDVSILAEDELICYFRLTAVELAETKAVFIAKGFIDKKWNVLKWNQRQTSVSKSAIRMRTVRERKRNALRNVSATVADPLRATFAQLARPSEEEMRLEENRGESPLPLVTPIGPEYTPVGVLAEELGGDCSWSLWVSNMGRLGHPASWIDYTLRTLAGRGQLRQDYAAGMLRKLHDTGGPPKPSANGPSGQFLSPESAKKAESDRKMAEVAAHVQEMINAKANKNA